MQWLITGDRRQSIAGDGEVRIVEAPMTARSLAI
jgi:hypothetical protein